MSIRRGILNWLRSLNKIIFNRFTRKFAGKPRSPLALIRHMGRRSGKTYETPVIAERIENGFIIPIAYGTDSDWYHNVMASGRGKMVWRGQEYAVRDPRPIEKNLAISKFPVFPKRLLLWILGTEHLIQMSLESHDTK